MMKRFQFENKQIRIRSKRRSKATITIVSVLVVLGFLSLLWPNLLTGTMHTISRPIWKFKTEVFDGSTLGSIVSYFKSKNSLTAINNSLKENLSSQEHRLLELELVRAENIRLREALGMKESSETSVFAYILSKPNKTPYDTLILNAGVREGVRVGDFVRSGESIILGEIVRVQENTSQARLFSTPNIKSEIVIGGSLGSIAQGAGGGNFRIKLPRDITVKEGMSVRLSNFPKTLIGFVEAIERKSSDSFQNVFVRSPINIGEIESVFIVHINE